MLFRSHGTQNPSRSGITTQDSAPSAPCTRWVLTLSLMLDPSLLMSISVPQNLRSPFPSPSLRGRAYFTSPPPSYLGDSVVLIAGPQGPGLGAAPASLLPRGAAAGSPILGRVPPRVFKSSHLILCRPLLLLPPIPPSIRVFFNESTLRMRWPKYGVSALASFLPKKSQG